MLLELFFQRKNPPLRDEQAREFISQVAMLRNK
jgi:hypothetical protein